MISVGTFSVNSDGSISLRNFDGFIVGSDNINSAYFNETKTKISRLVFDFEKYSFGLSASFQHFDGVIEILYGDSRGVEILASKSSSSLSFDYNHMWDVLDPTLLTWQEVYAYYGFAEKVIPAYPWEVRQTSFDTYFAPSRIETLCFGNILNIFDPEYSLPDHGFSFATNFRFEYYDLCCQLNFNSILGLLNGN